MLLALIVLMCYLVRVSSNNTVDSITSDTEYKTASKIEVQSKINAEEKTTSDMEFQLVGNTDELKHWLAEGVITERLLLDEESDNPFDNNFPVVRFSAFGTIPLSTDGGEEIQQPARILYCSDAPNSDLTVHFKLDNQPVFDHSSLVSIKSPSGEIIEVVEDSYNENYYYMNLNEEGYYLVEYRVWQDWQEDGESSIPYESAFYWKR